MECRVPGFECECACPVAAGAGIGGSSALAITVIAALREARQRLKHNALPTAAATGDYQLVRTAQDIEAKIISARRVSGLLGCVAWRTECHQLSGWRGIGRDIFVAGLQQSYSFIPLLRSVTSVCTEQLEYLRGFFDGDARLREGLAKIGYLIAQAAAAVQSKNWNAC